MVVIVVNTVLVASRGSVGLNAAKKVVVNQHGKGVVDRLSRNAPDIRLDDVGHFVGGHVWSTRDRTEHGEPLGRHLNPVFAKLINGGDSH
jgi:hypothetical protein